MKRKATVFGQSKICPRERELEKCARKRFADCCVLEWRRTPYSAVGLSHSALYVSAFLLTLNADRLSSAACWRCHHSDVRVSFRFVLIEVYGGQLSASSGNTKRQDAVPGRRRCEVSSMISSMMSSSKSSAKPPYASRRS